MERKVYIIPESEEIRVQMENSIMSDIVIGPPDVEPED